MCRVKGKLQVEASFGSALPSLTRFYARLLDDPPPYVLLLSCHAPQDSQPVQHRRDQAMSSSATC